MEELLVSVEKAAKYAKENGKNQIRFPVDTLPLKLAYNRPAGGHVSFFNKAVAFYTDPEYFREIQKLAFPIIVQQLVFSALNLLGVVFVGQKGDIAVAAVGLAEQIAFLVNLVHFGIISGAAMFTAQFWGKRDIPNLHRVLGLMFDAGHVCQSGILHAFTALAGADPAYLFQ